MCISCGCNYANYDHNDNGIDTMVVKMGGSFYGGKKVIDNMPKPVKVPAMKRTTKKVK